MKRKCALWAHLHLHAVRKLNSTSIPWERLVSVDANSRRSGFLPPHQSSAVSAPSLPPQNATDYTTTPRQNKIPAEKSSARVGNDHGGCPPMCVSFYAVSSFHLKALVDLSCYRFGSRFVSLGESTATGTITLLTFPFQRSHTNTPVSETSTLQYLR